MHEDYKLTEQPSMNSHDAKLQEVLAALQKMSVRLSRLEESVISPHERFSLSYFHEMTRSLSIPGVRFIGERLQHGVHSYLWLFIHVIALLISFDYIKEEYDNWQTSPVIRTLSNNLTFVHEVPFPAVTVCVPYSIKNDYDFFQNLEKCFTCNATARGDNSCSFNSECDRDEIETLAIASLLCAGFEGNQHVFESPATVFSRDVSKSIGGELFSNHFRKLLPPCDFLITQKRNEIKEVITGCNKNGFQHFLAFGANGICTTVNGLWHEDIYKENTEVSIPLQPNSIDKSYIGHSFTLENMMYFKGGNNTTPVYFAEDDYFTYQISERQNHKYQNVCNFFPKDVVASIILHNPAEIPLFQDLEQRITINKYNFIKVIPKLVTTKKDLTKYDPYQRGCFYSHERELMLFKYYTENSCEDECVVNCSLSSCSCVPPYLPRPNISVPVCLSECKVNCDCGCLPDCISLSYEVETKEEVKFTNGSGMLFVYYKRKSFYSMIRVGINDLADFMAYSFGILGTFNGFSVMVIFELFYFMTLRLWSSIKAYGSEFLT